MIAIKSRGIKSALTIAIRDDGVATILLDLVGEPFNSMRPETIDAFDSALTGAIANPQIKAVLIASAKPDSFIFGFELQVLQSLPTSAAAYALCKKGQALAAKMANCPKPIVAAIHGPAFGAGCEIALACQARVFSNDEKTVLALDQVKLGILPAMNGLQRLAALAGLEVAIEYGLYGKVLSAFAAKKHGIADDVVSAERVMDQAAKRALQMVHAMPSLEDGSKRSWARPSLAILRKALTKTPLRTLLFRKVRKELMKKKGGHHLAEECIASVLEVFAKHGLDASKEVEANLFATLVISTTAHRLMEVSCAEAALELEAQQRVSGIIDNDGDRSYTARILSSYSNEAEELLMEGVSIESINEALETWGFPANSIAPGDIKKPFVKSRVAIEEIQMRCALALVNEALRCYAEELIASPRHGDIAAISGAGFPRFRGGPFRYVDTIGAAEALKRVEAYHLRFGKRWAPAPILIEMARENRRFY